MSQQKFDTFVKARGMETMMNVEDIVSQWGGQSIHLHDLRTQLVLHLEFKEARFEEIKDQLTALSDAMSSSPQRWPPCDER